jgi:hypothetical protein
VRDTGAYQKEFSDFCRAGRLVGTIHNTEAAAFLERSLEARGFVAHAYVDRRALARPIAMALGILAFAILYLLTMDTVAAPAFMVMMLGPIARGAHSIRKGAPLCVFGVPSSPSSSPSAPTIVIGAHSDSTSAIFSGSLVAQSLKLLGYGVLCTALADLVSPLAVWVAAAAGGYFMFGNASRGGDDNASGVFAVLDCVDRLSGVGGVNIVPVFFNFEEVGLFGSAAFFRRYLSKQGGSLHGIPVDHENAYLLNFDCVGRGKRIFVSGSRELVDDILATKTAQDAKASATAFYASDHLSFKRPWKVASFARANRLWMLDLAWVHSKADVPGQVNLAYIDEVAAIAEECVREIAARPSSRLTACSSSP